MILDAVRESGGLAVAAPEADIPKWMQIVCSLEGIAICPETAVCYSALERLRQHGLIKDRDRILIFNTAAAQKYPETICQTLPHLDVAKPIDWEAL